MYVSIDSKCSETHKKEKKKQQQQPKKKKKKIPLLGKVALRADHKAWSLEGYRQRDRQTHGQTVFLSLYRWSLFICVLIPVHEKKHPSQKSEPLLATRWLLFGGVLLGESTGWAHHNYHFLLQQNFVLLQKKRNDVIMTSIKTRF